MARGTAPQQREATAGRPVNLQKARRRKIVGTDHGSARDPERLALFPAQYANDAITQVSQVGGACLQIFVGRGLIFRNLRIERRAPRAVRRRPLADRKEDRIEKILVLQERNLEFENLRSFASGRRGEFGDLTARSLNRTAKREHFLGRRAGHALAVRAGINPDERSTGKADRGGPAAVGPSCDICPHAMGSHPENL